MVRTLGYPITVIINLQYLVEYTLTLNLVNANIIPLDRPYPQNGQPIAKRTRIFLSETDLQETKASKEKQIGNY